jgi:hypothetical protein
MLYHYLPKIILQHHTIKTDPVLVLVTSSAGIFIKGIDFLDFASNWTGHGKHASIPILVVSEYFANNNNKKGSDKG